MKKKIVPQTPAPVNVMPQEIHKDNFIKQFIDERTARANKIIVPHNFISATVKEKNKLEKKLAKKEELKRIAEEKKKNKLIKSSIPKEPKPKKEPKVKTVAIKLIDKEEEKKILALDCKKHYKMFLLYKGGYSKREIAELLTNGNGGYVSNELKRYAEDPDRAEKFKI